LLIETSEDEALRQQAQARRDERLARKRKGAVAS
jgi:hypothetical protein